ncbi:hypothetical protein [uncultured Rikenella sp.]|uniref:hypothetical protein n=1 Tax=uncultured Rikenella sp. TaxID=368003 RepID=UPI002608D8C4|nr:hypothetical protein [uncultured Rikenella sp.]
MGQVASKLWTSCAFNTRQTVADKRFLLTSDSAYNGYTIHFHPLRIVANALLRKIDVSSRLSTGSVSQFPGIVTECCARASGAGAEQWKNRSR